LNNFLVEKSTADAILILLHILVLRLLPFSVALVLTPVLSGLAIFVTTPPSKSTKVYAIVEDSKSNGMWGGRNYCNC
jgi:hypothetical protein